MKSFMVSAYAILLLGFATVAQTAETDAVCPVSGKKAAKVSMSHNGGEVYFCCKNCRKTFKKDASKFSVKANEQLIKTGQASQQKCPISGGKMKNGTELDVDGVSVAFCCKNCRKKVDQASGDEKLAMVFGDEAFKKGYVVAAQK
jgi:YHS domain-containing protein